MEKALGTVAMVLALLTVGLGLYLFYRFVIPFVDKLFAEIHRLLWKQISKLGEKDREGK